MTRSKLIYAPLILLVGLFGIITSVVKWHMQPASLSEQYGAGYTPVTDYEARTTSYISSSATTIPVNSTLDKAGNQIVITNISSSSTPYAYFSLEPGTSREEIIACSAVASTNWSSCLRGLSFQAGSMTPSTTLQYAHNAGSRMVMTDVGQFFTEYVSISGTQTIFDLKTFNQLPRATSTSALATNAAEFATKYYVDQVGAGGFTSSNVDPTKGLYATGAVPEKVGIFLSSTSSGLYFNSTWSPNYPLTVQTSSTGGLVVNGVGSLIIDTSDAQTWTGVQTFSSTVVASVGITIPAPTEATSGTNMSYVSNSITANSATGTASVNITAGQALYISATSTQLLQTNTSVASSTYQFVGVAVGTVTVGQTVTYTKPGGINCSQSGLSTGIAYYLNGTAGQMSITPGTFSARIGRATSAGCLQVESPKFVKTGTFTISGTGDTVTNVGFYPAHVEIRSGCGDNGGTAGYGFSIGDETNRTVAFGYNGTNFVGGANTSLALINYCNGATATRGTVSARDSVSFTVNVSAHSGVASDVQYTAWSE